LKLDIEFKCLTRPASLLYTPELRWKNKWMGRLFTFHLMVRSKIKANQW
jgi:hypothetical protein